MEPEEKKVHLAKARDTVLRLYKYRPRSEKEVFDKLSRKGFAQSIIREVINRFKKIGMIDDRQFAFLWTRSRLNKPFGIRRIRYELRQKGIDSSLIQDTLSTVSEDHDEWGALLGLAKKRYHHYSRTSPEKAKQRLFGYLCRRGFNSSRAYKAVQAAIKDHES